MSHTHPPELSATVYVIDNDAAACDEMGSMMLGEGWIAETFTSCNDFIAFPKSLIPGCVLLSVVTADSATVDLCARIVGLARLPLVVLAVHCDVPTTVGFMKAGAFEVLARPCNGDVLLNAVHSAVSASRAAVREQLELAELGRLYGSLSLREREVMSFVVKGRLNKLIGAALGISEITVKAHRGRVMRKMGADSLAHLVLLAAVLGLTQAASERASLSSYQRCLPKDISNVRLRTACA